MPYVIRSLHDEKSAEVIPELMISPNARWLKSFDPDAYGGLGRVEWTHDVDQAIKFRDFIEAKDYFIQQSTVRPLRVDGKPNRPLTGCTVTFERYGEK
jgi:hypothetical protein